MRNGSDPGRRKWSAGTKFMLALLAVVVAGSALVLGRLSSGASVDLTKLNMNVLDIAEDPAHIAADETEDMPETKPQAKKTAAPAAQPLHDAIDQLLDLRNTAGDHIRNLVVLPVDAFQQFPGRHLVKIRIIRTLFGYFHVFLFFLFNRFFS